MRRITSLLVPALFLTAAEVDAQSSARLQLLSKIAHGPCTTGDVWGMGDYMLLARRAQGFAVVDARDPGNPKSKTIRPPGYPASGRSYGVGDIKSDGRYIYASDEYRNQGVYIYDAMPDPMNPKYIGSLGSVGRVHNFWVEGNILVTNAGRIYDITNKASPRQVGTYPRLGTHDVMIKNGRLYVSNWSRGIYIYDLANPRAPRLLGSKSYSGAATHNMWPTDDGKFLFTTDENLVSGVGGFVRVWDISRLPTITQVGQFKTGARDSVVHNVQVHGSLLFVSYYKEGLRVLSITDPKNPVEIAHYDTYAPLGSGCFGGPYAGCWGVYPWGLDRVYVSDLDSGGYILSLKSIPSTFTAKSLTVQRGNTIDLSFAFRNAAPTALGGFGVVAVTSVNNAFTIVPMLTSLRTLNPSQSSPHAFKLPVPAAVPPGLKLGFTAWSGHFAPLLVCDQTDLTITIR